MGLKDAVSIWEGEAEDENDALDKAGIDIIEK